MSGLDPAIAEWVEGCCEQAVAEAVRIPGGASRQAWVVKLANGQRRFLRMDAGESALSAVGYDLGREARVYEWLADTPVGAAGFCGVRPDGRALLLEFVEGAPGPLDDPDLAREFMGQVNVLHSLEPPVHLANDDMAVWSRAYREHCPRSDPLIDLGLRWLAEAAPGPPERQVLVHGDLGPGNVLHDGRRVTGLCDWELAHVGDPMEDLAWITVRAMLTPFVDIDTAFGWYDGPVDPERVRYWQLACQIRNLIGLGVTGAAGGDLGMGMLFSTLHRRVTAELLCEAMGVVVERPQSARSHRHRGERRLRRGLGRPAHGDHPCPGRVPRRQSQIRRPPGALPGHGRPHRPRASRTRPSRPGPLRHGRRCPTGLLSGPPGTARASPDGPSDGPTSPRATSPTLIAGTPFLPDPAQRHCPNQPPTSVSIWRLRSAPLVSTGLF